MALIGELTSKAIEYGAIVAKRRRVRFEKLFRDSLHGDLARLEVRRMLRKRHPGTTAEQREAAIETGLTQ